MADNNNKFRGIYEKLVQAEGSIDGGLDKAAAVLTNVSYISNPRLRGALRGINLAIGAGMLCHTLFKYIQESVEGSMYSVTIDDLDENIFNIASELMLEYQDESNVKDYSVRTYHERIPYTNQARVLVKSEVDQDTSFQMEFAGFDYHVSLNMPDPPSKGKEGATVIGLRNITFYCKKLEGIRRIEEALQERITEKSKRGIQPKLFINGDYGFSTHELRGRPLESVVLKNGQMESIVNHINRFLEDEEQYNKYGIPYHTGILLQGPPGTGKTSISTVLSTNFQMNMYHISLTSFEDDDDLMESFSGIASRSIVVLEDLDVLGPSSMMDRDVERKGEGITMSGLLNVLDGNLTPHGMILIATTNNPENIDQALTRAGRIDLTEEIGYVNTEQLVRLAEYFTGEVYEFPQVDEKDGVSTSDISGIFREHLNTPKEAVDQIRKFIETRKAEKSIEVS